MRRAGLVAAWIGAAILPLASSVAHAKPIAFASQHVDVASLPAGHLLTIDRTHKPATIGSERKVAGVRITRDELAHARKRGHVTAGVRIAEDGRKDDAPAPAQVCFDNAETLAFPDPKKAHEAAKAPAEAEKWTSQGAPVQDLRRYSEAGKFDDRVQLVQVDALEPVEPLAPLAHVPGGAMALHLRDFWVDVETGGAQLQHEATLPLRDMGTELTGVHLYAAKTDDELVFVAAHDETVDDVSVRTPGEFDDSSPCGHAVARVALQRGTSGEAVVSLTTTRKEVLPALPGSDADPTTIDHARTGHLTVSVQWEPDDAEPLVAFSAGWDGREHLVE